jgi:DNA invertase Pin-like site-specific DNA recombinase
MTQKSNSNGRPLRFANLIRVSTEEQEKRGESLQVQTENNQHDVERVGGTIVELYGGQEHATPGWEQKELTRLMEDAKKGRWDAVIVSLPDRWSRDNSKSDERLDTLRGLGIRFFVSSMEMNLFDINHRMLLSMNALFGRWHTMMRNKQSIESRIKRLRNNQPAAGNLPWGRTFDKDTKTWGIDASKQAMIQDIAQRYLAGEALPKLAREYSIPHNSLCRVLRKDCGPDWAVTIDNDDFNIHETIPLTIPALLPPKLIKRVLKHLEANRTYLHTSPKRRPPEQDPFVLRQCVFCAGCGTPLVPQPRPSGKHYYRHALSGNAGKCPWTNPRPGVPAEALELDVLNRLFSLLGNPAAIERATKAAVPDCDKVLRLKQEVEAELDKIATARNRVLGLIERDAISVAQAEGKLVDMKQREAGLRNELERLAEALASVPDDESIKVFVDRVARQGKPADIVVYDAHGRSQPGGNDLSTFLMMSEPDQRQLVRAVFGEPMPDGTPSGVYITPVGGAKYQSKRFTYEMKGHLTWRVMPCRCC